MGRKIELDGSQYDIDNLSAEARNIFQSIQFSDEKLRELQNMVLVLKNAKKNCMDSLKKEILSNKAGFVIED